MTSSIGMIRNSQYFWENKIDGNQTTNQIYIYIYTYVLIQLYIYIYILYMATSYPQPVMWSPYRLRIVSNFTTSSTLVSLRRCTWGKTPAVRQDRNIQEAPWNGFDDRRRIHGTIISINIFFLLITWMIYFMDILIWIFLQYIPPIMDILWIF